MQMVSPVKESRSTKLMWFVLAFIMLALIVAVVLYVVYNGNGKVVKVHSVNEENKIEMEKLDKSIDWGNVDTWKELANTLYEQKDEIEALESNSKTQMTYPGENADFIIIDKSFENSQELIYFVYRGKVGTCQFEQEYWKTISQNLRDDFPGALEDLKSGPACTGDFFEDDVIKYLGSQTFLNLNMTEEDLDLSDAKVYELTTYKKENLSLDDYRSMSTCGDMNCFIEKAKLCERTSYLEEGKSNMFFGEMMPEAVFREVLGQEEDGRCIYRSSIVDLKFYLHPFMKNALFSEIIEEGMTGEEEELAIESYLNEASTDFAYGLYCKYPLETLLEMLDNEMNSAYSTAHFLVNLCRSLKEDGTVMTPQEMGQGEMQVVYDSGMELGDSMTKEIPWEIWE